MNNKKTVMVVDAQGGGLGRAIIEKIKKANLNIKILAIGTNSSATMAMFKAGADEAATGENAVIYNAKYADYIIGGIGIIAANSMLGEISPNMAEAISSSPCLKILIPINKCNFYIVGVEDSGIGEKIDEAIKKLNIDREL